MQHTVSDAPGSVRLIRYNTVSNSVVSTPEQEAITVNGFLIMQMAIIAHHQDKDCPHELLCDV